MTDKGHADLGQCRQCGKSVVRTEDDPLRKVTYERCEDGHVVEVNHANEVGIIRNSTLMDRPL